MALLAMNGDKPRPEWFAAWALAGVLVAFGVSALGVFTMPIGLVLAFALSRRHTGSAALGFVAGLSGVVAALGAANLDYRPCTSAGDHAHLALSETGPVGSSCGGIDGLPWMIVGIAVVVVALLLYLRASYRPPRTRAT
jgi:hypothetical protein